MNSIASGIRDSDFFLRRRDLLAAGFTDAQIRGALGSHSIFRVRQGWYSVPDAPQAAIDAIRVGGRLTATSALESYGLPVPRRPNLHVAVVRTSSRLRSRSDRRARLGAADGVLVHWVDRPGSGGSVWRVSLGDALLAVLVAESRDIAVACASAIMRRTNFTVAELTAVFARAPEHCGPWLALASPLDDSHGETFFRLWMMDVGHVFEQQFAFPGVGRVDFRVGPHTFVEIDGAQHDPDWIGESRSSYEGDHDRDTTVAIGGGTTLRYTYRQLYGDWARVLAAVERTIADDLALTAYRARHPFRLRVHSKRRRSARKAT